MKSVSLGVAAVLASSLALLFAAGGGRAKASVDSSQRRPLAAPAWARPPRGVRPSYVEHDYGTSRGLTCDLLIYTTNRAALHGRARLRPGDITATVCVVRRVVGR